MTPIFDSPKKNVIDYSDFTVKHYRTLLQLARSNWPIAVYNDIPWNKHFLLWRHDCDYSLNRAKALAQIEREEGVRATYFVNPRCEFYNLLERSQIDILRELQDMGHQVALHFDCMFHVTHDELELVKQLQIEASLLEMALGVRPTAFSFHNPSTFHLSCEEESYAGMLNCYSERFKKNVGYISDSNGYWRYRRLHDVLLKAEESSIQVLTHPGWWQDEVMTPRQKVFRAVYGRADAIIRFFDEAIDAGDRENPGGVRKELALLKSINHPDYELLDQLFHREEYVLLILALWRLHAIQTIQLCQVQLRKQWGVPVHEINAFFENSSQVIDSGQLFNHIFGISLHQIAGIDQAYYDQLLSLRNELILGNEVVTRHQLEDGCVFLCKVIESLVVWGKAQSMNFNGINELESFSFRAYKTSGCKLNDSLDEAKDEQPSFSKIRWQQLKVELQKNTNSSFS